VKKAAPQAAAFLCGKSELKTSSALY